MMKRHLLYIKQYALSSIISCVLSGNLSYSFHLPQPTTWRQTRGRYYLETPPGSTTSSSVHCTSTSAELIQQVDALLQETEIDPMHILNTINEAHERDLEWAKSSLLPFERALNTNDDKVYNSIEYEYINVDDTRASISHDNLHERPIAICTAESTPLLHPLEIQLLKSTTEAYWNDLSDDATPSRFTYQRKGNREAHLSDVVNFSNSVQMKNGLASLVDEMLLHRVYPWIREVFLSKEENINSNDLKLYVYDSLYIRYNATDANDNDIAERMGQQRGAGQPLHRDLGYVSVNIMLNDHCEFDGGGTFFEQQLLSLSSWNESYVETDAPTLVGPLKPLGAGHALAHFSSDRHAGAATMEGVRDILVLFIAVAREELTNQTGVKLSQRVPRWEQSARLKTTARSYCKQCFPSGDRENTIGELICRMQHLRLAIDAVPNDGEAFHYLGMALSELDDSTSIDLAIACLQEGIKYTPCDARLYNNIGLVWEKKLAQCNSNNGGEMQIIHDKITSAYETAIAINSICTRIGCDVRSDFERACLNFALYLSYQDDFQSAIRLLERIQPITSGSESRSPESLRVSDDARSLLLFCRKQLTGVTQ